MIDGSTGKKLAGGTVDIDVGEQQYTLKDFGIMLTPRNYDQPVYTHPVVTTVLLGIVVALLCLASATVGFVLYLVLA